MSHRLFGLLLTLSLLLLAHPPTGWAQVSEPQATMHELHQAARLANGVGPLAWSEALGLAAQRHAEEIAQREDPGHIGLDGSSPQQRAARAGYGGRASENWSTGSALKAMAFFLEDEIHRTNMLLPQWREIGVGHARTSWGGELWVVLYGTQPGVLPIFIEEGAERTTQQLVRVRLSGIEESGLTPPVEVQVAEAGRESAQPWLPWQPELLVELTPPGGEKMVVASYRDSEGRIVQASDRIFLVLPGGPLPTSPAQLAPTLTPSATPTVTPTPTNTATPTATPTVTPTPTPTPLIPPEVGSLLFLGGFVLSGLMLLFLVGLWLLRRGRYSS